MPNLDTTPNTSYIKGLTDQENRELAGVLDPSYIIDPQSRLGEDGALQIQVDTFQEIINETTEQRDKHRKPRGEHRARGKSNSLTGGKGLNP